MVRESHIVRTLGKNSYQTRIYTKAENGRVKEHNYILIQLGYVERNVEYNRKAKRKVFVLMKKYRQ